MKQNILYAALKNSYQQNRKYIQNIPEISKFLHEMLPT